MKHLNSWAAEALRQARRNWGVVGWAQLTDDMRDAYIARAAVDLLLTQDDSISKYAAGKGLVQACMEASKARTGGGS